MYCTPKMYLSYKKKLHKILEINLALQQDGKPFHIRNTFAKIRKTVFLGLVVLFRAQTMTKYYQN